MACNKKVTGDLINDCTVNPVLGLKGGVILNYDDIDFTALTKTGSIITNLSLIPGSGLVGFKVSWLKRMGSNNNALVASPTEREGFTHSFACQLAGYSAINADRLNELKNGKYVIVAESNFRGVNNEDTYKVFGIDTGLYLTEAVHSSNENGGAITYILSTQEGNLEEHLYNTLLETDYATTKASYDTLFLEA